MARFLVKVVPNARQNAVAGRVEIPGGAFALSVRLKAPPVDGKANEALVAFLAETFGVPRRAVRLLRGERDRLKQIEIDGLPDAAVDAMRE